MSRDFSQKKNEWFFFSSWQLGITGNLNFDFKFQVLPSHQDRKTNSGDVTARLFCFDIYWPLVLKVGPLDDKAGPLLICTWFLKNQVVRIKFDKTGFLACKNLFRNLFFQATQAVKFIYSEKATKFCKIFHLLLTTVHTVKN